MLFAKADRDGSGALNFDECCQLLVQLNLKMEPSGAKKMFDVIIDGRHLWQFIGVIPRLTDSIIADCQCE